MSYIVHHKSAKFSRSLIGYFAPDLSLVVATTNSISLYTLDLVLLKNKILLDEVLQIEKYHHGSRDGVAIMFRENRISFVYYDYTINDFSVYALKYFSRYPSADPFFRLQGEIGFAKLNEIHFAIFCIHTKTQSVVFSFRDLKRDLRNVTDACFLSHYMLPTICFLYRPHVCKYTREEDVRVLVVSFDLHTRASFVQYDYRCMPHTSRIVGLEGVLAVVSRNFLSFYKNECVYTLTNNEKLVKLESAEKVESHLESDIQGESSPCEMNNGIADESQNSTDSEVDRISAKSKGDGDAFIEQQLKFETAFSQACSTAEPSDMPKRCSQYMNVDFDESEFIGQSRTLLIFAPTKTLLVTPREDSHKVYDLHVLEAVFKAESLDGCTEDTTFVNACARAMSVFENIVFTGVHLLTLKEHVACHGAGPQACERILKTITKVGTLEKATIVCSTQERGQVPDGYSRIYVANDKVCLTNDTSSIIQNMAVDFATINLHYLGGVYYHITSSRINVLDDQLVNIGTFDFERQIRKSHAHGEAIVLLEDSCLVIRDRNMKIVREIPDVHCFTVNEVLVVTREAVVEIISLENMELIFRFNLDDFGPTAVSELNTEDVPDGAEKQCTNGGRSRIVEIESFGDRENFHIALRSDEDDFFVYRVFRNALIKVSHGEIPEFGPGESLFRMSEFLYIKAKTSLVASSAPFAIQECALSFEHVSGVFGIQDGKLLEAKFERRPSDTCLHGNALHAHGVPSATRSSCNGACTENDSGAAEHTSSANATRKVQVLEACKNGVRNYVVVTTRPAIFTKEKVEAQPENSEEDMDVEQIGADTLQFALELCSSEHKFIHEYELQKDEYVNSMRMLVLNDIHSPSGRGEFLVVCTSYVKSEDWQFKGRLLLFELIEVNPVPLRPWTNRKLKILCIENCKGPVLDCCSLRGNIACCMGTKLMVYEVDRNEGINAIAFHDLQILATRIRAVKNYVCLGDIANGLMFFYFQAKPFKIHLLASSSKFCCDGLDFIIHKNILSMVAHGDGVYRIYTYTPTNMFFDGTQLIKRCEFKSTDAVDVVFADSDLVDRLYFRMLKSLRNTCGLTSPSTMAGDRLQPHTVRPPIYGSLLYEFMNLGLREQRTICTDATVERRNALASLRHILNK